jgi:branched-chain amino acid transport system ATP-binding protein
MALLEVRDVFAGYHNGPDILTGLSIRFEPDRSYCIVGPNGAGKSTLLKVICGLLRPRKGEVLLDGEPLSGRRTDEILQSGICFVPQDRSLFPDMTVRENLRMGGYILKDRRAVGERIETVFDMFPILRERHSQLAKTLSGGQQQMLLIGRALVLRPRIIMLDEPSLGLAPTMVDNLFEALAQIRERGVTILLVEQRAQRTVALADRTHVLANGELRMTLGPGDADDTDKLVAAYLAS